MHPKKRNNLSASDESRVKQIFNTFDNLSEEGKTHVILRLPLSESGYKRKTSWTLAEDNALRLAWNRTNHDEICDGFACSYDSMLARAVVLGLFPQDSIPLTGEDVEIMVKGMSAGISVKDMAEKYELEYDFKETHSISDKALENINEMKQELLFNGENNDCKFN